MASLEPRHAGDTPTTSLSCCKTPTATGVEGAGGTAGPGPRSTGEIGRPGCGARGLRGTWAAVPVGGGAGQRANVPIEARGADGRSGRPKWAAEVGGADTTASQISHAIPPQHESTQAQKPQNINDQNPNPDMRSREVHANCWLTAIAGHQGDAPNHTSAH